MSSSTLDSVLGYHSRGWCPIPVPSGKKRPVLKGWQNLRFSKEDLPIHFSNGTNVGILLGDPSANLIDVDLDWPEARALAEAFLPVTHRVSGRAGAPYSHYWYIADPLANTKKFEDPVMKSDEDGRAMIVEFRGTGAQTIVPPSRHPSGEFYEWHEEGDPAKVSGELLLKKIRLLAACALTSRYWQDGKRHDLTLSLASILLRNGWQIDDVEHFIIKAAEVAGDDDIEDRRRVIHDVPGRLKENKNTPGFPTFKELLPKDVANRILAWTGVNENTATKSSGRKDAGQDQSNAERRSMADRIIDYALSSKPLLFCDQYSQPHVLAENRCIPLTSRCYPWLRRLLFAEENRAAGGEALAQAAGTLAALAEQGGEKRILHVRSAQIGQALYVELQQGRILRVDNSSWVLDSTNDILYRAYASIKPLPMPEKGGTLESLIKLFPLRSERDKRLIIAYIACGLLANVPRPILLITGPMGSGKTTMHRMIKKVLDPTAPETIRLDPKDALQKASHCAVMLCDNLSSLSAWQVDILCRLVTGEGDSKRVLYTDDDDFVVEMKRLILLNGINPPADRADLLDRSLCIELDRVADDARLEESEIWATLEREHARWLGAIFDLLSAAMCIKDSLQLSSLPRLADWGRWAAAIYEAAGWGANTFIEDWNSNVKVQQSAVLDSSLLAQAVILFVDECEEWHGPPSILLDSLKTVAIEQLKIDPKRDSRFPRTADWLWRRLREILPLLTANGIAVSRSKGKARDITLRKCRRNGDDGDDGDGPVIDEALSDDTNSDTIFENGNGVENGDEAKSKGYKPFDASDTNDTIFTHLSEDELSQGVCPGPAIWRNRDHDQPVTVISEAGKGSDGRRYVNIVEGIGAIPFDEVFYDEKPSAHLGSEFAICPGCSRTGLQFTHCDGCGEFLR